MRAKLTKLFVDGLEPDPNPKKRLTVWDEECPGFGVMVTPRGERSPGVKSYIVQYRIGGRGAKTRRVTIGRHGREWQPGGARDEARKILQQVREKVDPFEERRRTAAAEHAARQERAAARERDVKLRLSAISESFVDRYAKVHQPSSWRNTERALADVQRTAGDVRIDEFGRSDVRKALEKIKRRSPSAAIEAHKALRKMYGWAVAEQIIAAAAHPMMLMEPPAKGSTRQRVLSSIELREVWFAADKLGYPFGSLTQFLLLTGLRLRECADALAGEFPLDQQMWIIPKARMKRAPDDERGDHVVPLGGLTVSLLERLPKIAAPEGVKIKPSARPLFTSNGAEPVSGFSQAKQRLDRQIAKNRVETIGVEAPAMDDWRNHDLRRTVATGLQALGIESRTIDLLHDHRVPGVSRVSRHYQLWDYFDEKRAAVEQWDCYVRGAVLGDEVHRDLVKRVDARLRVSA